MANARTVALRAIKSQSAKDAISRIESEGYCKGNEHLRFSNDWCWLKSIIFALQDSGKEEK